MVDENNICYDCDVSCVPSKCLISKNPNKCTQCLNSSLYLNASNTCVESQNCGTGMYGIN